MILSPVGEMIFGEFTIGKLTVSEIIVGKINNKYEKTLEKHYLCSKINFLYLIYIF